MKAENAYYYFLLFADTTTAAPTTPTAAKLKTIPVSGLSSGSFVVSDVSPLSEDVLLSEVPVATHYQLNERRYRANPLNPLAIRI